MSSRLTHAPMGGVHCVCSVCIQVHRVMEHFSASGYAATMLFGSGSLGIVGASLGFCSPRCSLTGVTQAACWELRPHDTVAKLWCFWHASSWRAARLCNWHLELRMKSRVLWGASQGIDRINHTRRHIGSSALHNLKVLFKGCLGSHCKCATSKVQPLKAGWGFVTPGFGTSLAWQLLSN